MKSLLLLGAFLCAATAAPPTRYNTAPPKRDPDKIMVHLVTHSHDDVGWLKTVDEYYAALNDTIQWAGVGYIIDTMTTELAKNPDRHFTFVEQAFFQRWWREASEDDRALARSLFNRGQLEFQNGGWCMHDEANTHYQAMLDQTTLGHQFLAEEFGAYPTVGWQIDPFGHSATQAALLSAEAGFSSLYFARIDLADHNLRSAENRLQMVWRASPSLGADAQVFTGVFHHHYNAPPGLCFDSQCSQHGAIQDDERLTNYNVDHYVDLFVKTAMEWADEQAEGQKEVMFLMGDDFQYRNAREWFKNLDKLIHYINKDGRVQTQYSSPSIYTEAVNKLNLTWTVKTDDFFPYADNTWSFWSGYFTSRPSEKGLTRFGSGFLRSASLLSTMGGGDDAQLEELREAMGVAQHHDAVTGTAKQHVAFDYYWRMSRAIDTASAESNKVLATLLGDASLSASLSQCHRRNVSLCDATVHTADADNGFNIVMFNAYAHNRTVPVRIPVPASVAPGSAVTVTDLASGTPVAHSGVVSNAPVPFVDNAAASSVAFMAELPVAGFSTYSVRWPAPKAAAQLTGAVAAAESRAAGCGSSCNATNGILTLAFDDQTGLARTLFNLRNGLSTKLEQTWGWYNSSAGGETNGRQWGAGSDTAQNSGAYIFRPNTSDVHPIASASASTQAAADTVPTLSFERTEAMTQVTQTWGEWLVVVYRLHAGADFVEVESTVGPIPVADSNGKEVVTRWTTDIESNRTFYTDSNAREFQKRVRDYRPTYPYIGTEPVAGNYYPVPAAIRIEDGTRAFSVLTDRAQGGTSLRDGEVELMVHRRILYDDGRGVGEPLDETSYISPYPNAVRSGNPLVIRCKHVLRLDKVSEAASLFRPQMDGLFLQPITAFFPLAGAAKVTAHSGSLLRAGLVLPSNVHIANLDRLPNGNVLLRLAHQFAVGEDPELSKPAKVDIPALFNDAVASVAELSLTASRPIQDVTWMQWNTEDERSTARQPPAPVSLSEPVVLTPMKIRSFEVVFQ